jgi:single-strand DNA-binding protein
MYSKHVIVGHLGRDPEMRYTQSGKQVTNFSVATNRRWTNADGETQEETTWFRIAAWGRLAEVTNEYLKKGRLVLVEGRLASEIRVYERNDGSHGASYELTAEVVRFLGGRSESAAPNEAAELDEDESIPF